MKIVRRAITSAAAACLALFLSTLCLAQSAAPAPPAHSRVTIYHVKPDMLAEWIDLQKNEVIPAQKKAGIASRITFQTALFGNPYEYVTVIPFGKYAEFDGGQSPQVRALGAPGAARLGAKLAKCLESSQSFVSNAMPELSTVTTADAPPIGVFTRVRVAPGKLSD
jgi:hypothetical protein